MVKPNQFDRYKGYLFLFFLLGFWESVSRANLVNPQVFFPPVTEILAALINDSVSFQIPQDLLLSLSRAIAGLSIATLIAVPIGIVMGYSRSIFNTLNVLVELLRPMPSSAIIPIAILFLGIFDQMKVVVVAFGCLWPILVNTVDGVRGIDPILIETGKTFGLGKRKFFWEIILKGSLPYIVAGLRISLAISLILTITVEMIAGQNGLGYYILNSELSYQFTDMYAGIFTIAIAGWSINKLFTDLVVGKLIRWHHRHIVEL